MQIWNIYSHDEVMVLAVNADASKSDLQAYLAGRGITFPCILDEDHSVFDSYQVGFTEYGNSPPTYLIIDRKGIVRYRTDNEFNTIGAMKQKIDEILNQ